MRDVEPAVRPSLGGALALSFGLGVLVLFALFAAGAVHEALPPVSLGAAVAGALALVGPLHAAVARAAHPRAPIGSYLGLLVLAPFVGIGALAGLSDPLVSTRFFCGTGRMALVMLAVPTFAGIGAVGCFVATAVAVRGRRRLEAAVAWAALVAIFAGTALVTAGAIRTAMGPDPDAWVESLPLAAVLPPAIGTPFETLPPRDGEPEGQRVYVDVAADLTLRRHCSPSESELRVVRGEATYVSVPHIDCEQPMTMRHDRRHGIWIVDERAAFSEDDLAPRDVVLEDVRDALAPPRASLAIAAFGLAVAGALAIRRRAARRALARVAQGMSGVAEANGWVALDDGLGSVRIQGDGGAEVQGPVVVIAGDAHVRGVYRGEGPLGRVTVLAGDKVDLLEKGTAALAVLGAQVFAIVALTSAPLVAAAIRGLVL